MSERRVVIRRSDGAVLPVDLARYRVTRDGRFNPYLREGDVVYVPFRGDMDNSLGVYGGKMRAAWLWCSLIHDIHGILSITTLISRFYFGSINRPTACVTRLVGGVR